MEIPQSLWTSVPIFDHGLTVFFFLPVDQNFSTLQLQVELGSIFSVFSDEVYGDDIYLLNLLSRLTDSCLSLSLFVCTVLQPSDHPLTALPCAGSSVSGFFLY